MSTRQYSKYQEKWLRMRLLQRKFHFRDHLIESMKCPLDFSIDLHYDLMFSFLRCRGTFTWCLRTRYNRSFKMARERWRTCGKNNRCISSGSSMIFELKKENETFRCSMFRINQYHLLHYQKLQLTNRFTNKIRVRLANVFFIWNHNG